MHLWGRKFNRIPEDWREAYLKRRTHEELLRDVSVAFDRIDELKLKLWVLGGTVAAQTAIIGWLATSLLNCLEAVHKVAAVLR